MVAHYTVFDYPSIPHEIEQECISFIETTSPVISKMWPAPGQCVFEVYSVPDALKDWFFSDQNPFDSEGYGISLQCMHSGIRVYPHIDHINIKGREIVKDFSINYLLTTADGITEWYDNVNTASVIEHVKFDKSTWHKIDTSVYHGVFNIDPTLKRTAITLARLLPGMPQFL